MLQSFIVYTIFGFCLFLLGSISARRQVSNYNLNKNAPFWVWDIVLALLIFAFFSGVRWNVGVDHLHYLANYLTVQNGGYSIFEKEYGFEFLTRLFADLRIHYSFYFGFLAFLQIFFIFRAFKDERYLYPFLGIIIIFGPEYLSWMNGIRQMLAATIFLWAVQFIQKRQLYRYVMAIAIASLMHKSALMLIAFYFIPQKDFFKNRIFTLCLFVLTIYLGTNNFWINNLNNIGGALEFLGYDKIAMRLDVLVEDVQIRTFGPRRLVLILIFIITLWLSPKLKIYFKNTYFLTYYNLAIIGILLYNLLGNTHHIFIRPITYLTIFSIPTTAYLLLYLKKNIRKYFLVFAFTLALTLIYLPLSIIADYGKGKQDYTNYKFYWHNEY